LALVIPNSWLFFQAIVFWIASVGALRGRSGDIGRPMLRLKFNIEPTTL